MTRLPQQGNYPETILSGQAEFYGGQRCRQMDRSGEDGSEGCQAIDLQAHSRLRMVEFQPAGVPHQTVRHGARGRRDVDVVAQDRVLHRLHVHAKLVRASGHGFELDPRHYSPRTDFEHAIAGQARSALGVIDRPLRATE